MRNVDDVSLSETKNTSVQSLQSQQSGVLLMSRKRQKNQSSDRSLEMHEQQSPPPKVKRGKLNSRRKAEETITEASTRDILSLPATPLKGKQKVKGYQNNRAKSADYSAQKNRFSLSLVPLTAKNERQQEVLDLYNKGYHLFLGGSAGTGKTFLALYKGLEEVLNGTKERVLILRSAVATVKIGDLPGSAAEKLSVYQGPYPPLVTTLFNRDDAYGILAQHRALAFDGTSFLRGITLKNTVVLFDEIQNATPHELSTVATRLGPNCRLILCGDEKQTDLKGSKTAQFARKMAENHHLQSDLRSVRFRPEDSVRSGFVLRWLKALEECEPENAF